MSREQRKLDKELWGCLLADLEGADAVFVYLRRLNYVANLGSTVHVTSRNDCTMKIFTSKKLRVSGCISSRDTAATFAFNSQKRRQDEDLRFCSVTNTRRERFEYEDDFI